MEKRSSKTDHAASEDDKIIHDFNDVSDAKKEDKTKPMTGTTKPPIILFLILLVLGVATGYVVAKANGSSFVKTTGPGGKIETTSVKSGQIFGSTDEKTFKDSAEGVLRAGGIDGEGAYHLERPGGDSQNVYMTSSIIDLSTFVGKKVKVWGETNAAEKAGWLMDVGRLQLLN